MYTYSERCRFDCLKHWASPSRLHASYWHANEAFPPSDQSTKHLEKSHNGFGVGRNLQPQNHLLIDLRLIDLKYIRPSNALNMSKIVQISTLSCCFPNHAVLLDINHVMTANTVQQNRLYAYHFFSCTCLYDLFLHCTSTLRLDVQPPRPFWTSSPLASSWLAPCGSNLWLS